MNKKRAHILFLLMAASAVIMATEIATDSLGNADPEWYVAPLVREPLRAPRRATATACSIDSIQTYNADSVLESVAVYEYGDTTRTMTWTVNADGTRVGTGRTEEGTNGNTTFTATYAWDNATGTWKGTTKEEHTFTGSKETLCTTYDWVNNAWTPLTQNTWAFDAAGRETEYTVKQRNTAGQLAYANQRIREYNAAGSKTLEIQYTAHNGTAWSAGTKELWEFNTAKLQTLHEKHTLSNSNWTITLREIKGYDDANNNDLIENYALQSNVWKGTKKEQYVFNSAKKKTSSIIYAWSNGAWVGSSKEIWEFNGPSAKQTLHEKSSWVNNDWQITLQENTGYDAAGNTILIENYTYTNGVQKGSKKTTYTFNSANKQTGNITYKWTNNAWVENVWTVSGYDAAGNKNESCAYKWTDGVWVGTGSRTLTTFNSSKKATEVITQSWSADAAAWVNSTRKTTDYDGSKTTQEATYSWQNDAWVGTSRSDWHYNAAGKNDTIKTYTYVGTEWIYSDRTAKTYNAAGTEIMVHNAHWDGTKWTMTSMTRTDISDITVDGIRQTVDASWICSSDSNWIGVKNDTMRYSATGKTLYEAHYVSWANNDWVPSYKIEFEYDETDHTIMNQRLNWSNNQWVGVFRYQYLYDNANRQLMQSQYIWSGNGWYGFSKTEMTYYSTGKQQSSISFSWVNNDWNPNQKTEYIYDNQGRTIDRKIFQYSNGAWENKQWKRYAYNSNGNEILNQDYRWVNDRWLMIAQNDYNYDLSDNKLRHETIGSWSTSGILYSYIDNHYFYACDPKYTIRFVNDDNTPLLPDQVLLEGRIPSVPAAPTKAADAQYTYTFAGWDKAIAAATEDVTYTATYNNTVNKYTITFKNEDGTELKSTEVEYGTMPTAPADPTKAATAQYTYTFKSWDKAIASVIGEATYTAIFDSTVNKYLITFKNDETTLQSTEVVYGVTPEYIGTTPVKQGDAQYTYTFKGWDIPIATVTKDTTYTATFSSTVNKYLVTFKNEDGTELKSETLDYGAMPTAPADPTKDATAQYTYTFAGWDKAIASVIGEATYTAIFDSTVNKYLITFKNDETTLQSTEVAYGVAPEYIGTTPVKQGDAQYTYTFKGWDIPIATVTKDTTYTATFSSTVNKYLVTFKNEDGAVLKSTEVDYGATPTAPADPTKDATAQYSYTFAGWDKAIATVTGEATYTATYTETQKGYTITWLNDDGSLIEETIVEFGAAPAHANINKERTAQYTFAFKGWSPVLAPVSGDATYTAVFDTIVNTYTVTFYFEDGITVLDQMTVAYGETPGTHLTPSEPMEEHYYYTFAGWSPEIVPVTGEASYTAVFKRVPKDYTITFRNYDKTLLQTAVFPYGGTPVYSGEEPAKKPNAQYTYTFAGWSPEITTVTGDATYTARFDDELNSYTVKWLNEDGTELDRQKVEYGAMPVYDGETPAKEADDQYIYTFKGWTPAVVRVTRDATYRATYTSQDKSQALEDVQGNNVQCTKILRGDQIYILRGNKTYTLQGVEIEE